jgi:hypothetical protein
MIPSTAIADALGGEVRGLHPGDRQGHSEHDRGGSGVVALMIPAVEESTVFSVTANSGTEVAHRRRDDRDS